MLQCKPTIRGLDPTHGFVGCVRYTDDDFRFFVLVSCVASPKKVLKFQNTKADLVQIGQLLMIQPRHQNQSVHSVLRAVYRSLK